MIFVPLGALVRDGRMKASEVTQEGKTITTYAFDYQGDMIWGATARILKQFLDITIDTTGRGDTDNGAGDSTSNRSRDSKAECNGVPWARDKVPQP